jgi:hypothetical protein
VNAIDKSGTPLLDYVLSEHAPQTKQEIVLDWPTDLKVRAGKKLQPL